MAATPKGAQKTRLDFVVDRNAYDVFVKACSHQGYAPQIILERLMKKYAENPYIPPA